MEDSFIRRRRLVAGLVASLLIVGACSSSGSTTAPSTEASVAAPSAEASTGAESAAPSAAGGQLGGTVSVIGTWTGAEQDSFMAMVAPWEQQTGAKVQYTGTRDINAVLSTGIQSGLLPDLAGLPGPGQMAEYYKAGALKALDGVLDVGTYTAQTSPGLVALGTIDGKITGIFIKADIKGLFWYNKDVYKAGDQRRHQWSASEATAPRSTANRCCVGLRVRRGHRVARHRLDRGLRPPPERSRCLRSA